MRYADSADNTGKAAPTQTEALLMFSGQLANISALVSGHKKTLVEQGIGEQAADVMAIAFHAAVMRRLFGVDPEKAKTDD